MNLSTGRKPAGDASSAGGSGSSGSGGNAGSPSGVFFRHLAGYGRLLVRSPLVWVGVVQVAVFAGASRIEGGMNWPTGVLPCVWLACCAAAGRVRWQQVWIAAGTTVGALFRVRLVWAALWSLMVTAVFAVSVPFSGRNVVEVLVSRGLDYGVGGSVQGWHMLVSFALLTLASQVALVDEDFRDVEAVKRLMASAALAVVCPWLVYVAGCLVMPGLMAALVAVVLTGVLVSLRSRFSTNVLSGSPAGVVGGASDAAMGSRARGLSSSSGVVDSASAKHRARRKTVVSMTALVLFMLLLLSVVVAMGRFEEYLWRWIVLAGGAAGAMVAVRIFDRGGRSAVAAGLSMTRLANRLLVKSTVAGVVVAFMACGTFWVADLAPARVFEVFVVTLTSSLALAHGTAIALVRFGAKEQSRQHNMAAVLAVGALQVLSFLAYAATGVTSYPGALLAGVCGAAAVVLAVWFRAGLRRWMARGI